MYHAFDAGNLYPEVMKYYEDDDPDLNKNKKNLKENGKKLKEKQEEHKQHKTILVQLIHLHRIITSTHNQNMRV